MFARQVMAWPFAAPPGVPRERVEALRRAFAQTMTDKEFVADAAKGNLEIRPVAGAEIEKLVLEMNATPPAVLQKTLQLLQ
jgi:tripartite-type tricarboxylate transporter receptor subunit TctC